MRFRIGIRDLALLYFMTVFYVQMEMPWVQTAAKPLVCLQHSGHGMVRIPPPGWSHASPEIYRRLGPTSCYRYGSVYGRVLHLNENMLANVFSVLRKVFIMQLFFCWSQ